MYRHTLRQNRLQLCRKLEPGGSADPITMSVHKPWSDRPFFAITDTYCKFCCNLSKPARGKCSQVNIRILPADHLRQPTTGFRPSRQADMLMAKARPDIAKFADRADGRQRVRGRGAVSQPFVDAIIGQVGEQFQSLAF